MPGRWLSDDDGFQPEPHVLVDVYAADGRMVGQSCQACEEWIPGPTLIAHPDDMAGAVSIAAGRPIVESPFVPKGAVYVLDETASRSPLGCAGRPARLT